MPTRKRRVFVSFDFDKDKFLKDAIVGQAKNSDSPFEISDWWMKEEAPQADWEKEATSRISRADTVVVMLGKSTYKASGVKKEVKMTNDLGKAIFQVIGYRTKPAPA